MGIVHKTLLDIVNAIAIKINGVSADSVHRPYKPEIIDAVNMAENQIIIDKPQYDFLRKTAVIQGWQLATGQTIKQLQNAAGTKSAAPGQLAQTPGFVTYIAEKYTAPAGQVLSPASVKVTFDCYASAGKLNGQLDAYICAGVTENSLDPTQDPAESIGYPDLNNILVSANTLNVVNDVFDASGNIAPQFNPLPNAYIEPTVTLNFSSSVPVSNQIVYWVVIKWTSQYYNGTLSANTNGRSMQFNQFLLPVSKSSLSWTGTNYPNSSNAIIGTWNLSLILNNGVFMAKNLQLPPDCNIPLRIGQPYNGTMGGIFMLPIGTDAVMYRQFNVPPGTFSITGEDQTTGCKLVSLNTAITIPTVGVPVTYPAVTLAAQYYVDYIANGGNLVLDTDISILPAEYRDLLIYKGMDLLFKLNAGLPAKPEENAEDFAYMMNKMNMKCMPPHSVDISVNVGGYTSAMAATRDTTLSQSLLQMQWPNTWQSTFAAGQNIGQMGGF